MRPTLRVHRYNTNLHNVYLPESLTRLLLQVNSSQADQSPSKHRNRSPRAFWVRRLWVAIPLQTLTGCTLAAGLLVYVAAVVVADAEAARAGQRSMTEQSSLAAVLSPE